MSHFIINNFDGYIIIEFPKLIYKVELDEFSQSTSVISSLNIHTVIFDLQKCEMLYNMVFPVVANFKMNLKKNGINLFSINVSKDVSKTIHLGGVEGFFSIFENFRQVQEKMGFKVASRHVLEVDILNLMFGGINSTFKKMFNNEAIHLKANIKSGPFIEGLGILCILNLFESEIIGAVKVYFPESFVLGFQKKKFNIEVDGISQKAIAEMELFAQNYFDIIQPLMLDNKINLKSTFPTVLVGKLSQLKQTKEVAIVMPFKSQYGDFWAEVLKG